MREYVVCALMFVAVYMHNSATGLDRERAELSRIRDSSGYLIRYEQTN